MYYHTFWQSLFGNHYTVHRAYLHGIHLYCLFVITLVVALCAYTTHQLSQECIRTFDQRVHALRTKYAAATCPLQH